MPNRKLVYCCLAIVFSFATCVEAQEQIARTLLIHGGGGMGKQCDDAFLAAAGSNPKLVVIPTASARTPDIKKLQETWGKVGFKFVTILHTRNRETANQPDFVKSLDDATAIWISGGSQSRLAEVYSGTLVEQKLLELNRRGIVIGGSSAGAAIQSRVMIPSGRDIPKLSTGFDLLPGTIIDQHFLARSRLNRLIQAVKKHPDRLGIGIDERTSILVKDNKATVSGRSYVITVRLVDGMIEMQSYESGESFELPSKATDKTNN